MRGLSPNWLLGTETLHLYIRRSRWMNGRTEAQKKETLKKDLPVRAYQPSSIGLTRTQLPLSGRAMEAIKELKRQDMNSYLYLLMEDAVREYLVGFYKKEMDSENAINPMTEKHKRAAGSGGAGKMFQRKPEERKTNIKHKK